MDPQDLAMGLNARGNRSDEEEVPAMKPRVASEVRLACQPAKTASFWGDSAQVS